MTVIMNDDEDGGVKARRAFVIAHKRIHHGQKIRRYTRVVSRNMIKKNKEINR